MIAETTKGVCLESALIFTFEVTSMKGEKVATA